MQLTGNKCKGMQMKKMGPTMLIDLNTEHKVNWIGYTFALKKILRAMQLMRKFYEMQHTSNCIKWWHLPPNKRVRCKGKISQCNLQFDRYSILIFYLHLCSTQSLRMKIIFWLLLHRKLIFLLVLFLLLGNVVYKSFFCTRTRAIWFVSIWPFALIAPLHPHYLIHTRFSHSIHFHIMDFFPLSHIFLIPISVFDGWAKLKTNSTVSTHEIECFSIIIFILQSRLVVCLAAIYNLFKFWL